MSQSPAPINVLTAALDNGAVSRPDLAGTVTLTHLLIMTAAEYRLMTKAGVLQNAVSLDSFWGASGCSSPFMLYDTVTRRVYAVACARSGSFTGLLLAVSQIGSPSGWVIHRLDAAPGTYFGFARLGLTTSQVVLMANVHLASDDSFAEARAWVVLRSEAASGNPLNPLVEPIGGPGAFSVVPAHAVDGGLDVVYLVYVRRDSPPQALVVLQIDGGGTIVPVQTYSLTSSGPFEGSGNPQSGTATLVENLDSRVGSAVFRNGQLWVAYEVMDAQGRSGVDVSQLDLSTSTPVRTLRFGGPDSFYAFPSLAVSRFGDVLVGFSSFGSGQFPSAAYGMWKNGVQRTARSYVDGMANYTTGGPPASWGHSSATAIDPSLDTFWTLQEYVRTGHRWGAAWANVSANLRAVPVMTTGNFFFTAVREQDGIQYFVRQDGVVFKKQGATFSTFLDLRSRVLFGGERGLLGFEFFSPTDFAVWFSEPVLGTSPPVVAISPCDPSTLAQSWTDRSRFAHVNRLEHWRVTAGVPARLRTLLRVLHPFTNHNGSNNLRYDSGLTRLVLGTGDEGGGLDPFGLAQDPDELHGKLVLVDPLDPVWTTQGDQLTPVTRFSELGPYAEAIQLGSKGLRNVAGLSYKDGLGLVAMAGESTVESAFAYRAHGKNFGWRPYEGTTMSVQVQACGNGNRRSVAAYVAEALRLQALGEPWRPVVAFANAGGSNVPPEVIQGSVITGVDLYFGAPSIPELDNRLLATVFGGQVLSAPRPDQPSDPETVLQDLQPLSRLNVYDFAGVITTVEVTASGLYVAGKNGSVGTVWQLVPF